MSYEVNVDFLLEDPTVKDLCKIAEVDNDSCKIAFLSAKKNCSLTEDQTTSVIDSILEEDATGKFAKQFFEKVTEDASVTFTCQHLNLLEYGNYEDEHPQSLVDDLQEKRKIISDFAKTMGDDTGMPENVQPEREQPELDS